MDNNEAWRNRETAMSHYRQEMADLQSELAASRERENALKKVVRSYYGIKNKYGVYGVIPDDRPSQASAEGKE